MAKLPRDRAAHLRPGWLLGLLLVLAAPAGAAQPVELIGTWHVLVHYTDSATHKADQPRWEDRLWVFEREGGRLKWVDYPLVIFEDQSGRFERLGTNRASRVLHYWEPSETQLAEIASGLQFNTRGSKSKSLRGSDAEGWSSSKSLGYQSARFITYTEIWQVLGPPERPSFRRDDVMGSAGAESAEGLTLYETARVEAEGNLLSGRYERDGTRRGSFQMRRSGTASIVRGSGKSQSERVRETFIRNLGGQLFPEVVASRTPEQELQAMIEAGDVPDDVRAQVRAQLRAFVEEQYRSQGNDPRAHQPAIQKLTRRIEQLYLDEGKSLEEIRRQLMAGEIEP